MNGECVVNAWWANDEHFVNGESIQRANGKLGKQNVLGTVTMETEFKCNY